MSGFCESVFACLRVFVCFYACLCVYVFLKHRKNRNGLRSHDIRSFSFMLYMI